MMIIDKDFLFSDFERQLGINIPKSIRKEVYKWFCRKHKKMLLNSKRKLWVNNISDNDRQCFFIQFKNKILELLQQNQTKQGN